MKQLRAREENTIKSRLLAGRWWLDESVLCYKKCICIICNLLHFAVVGRLSLSSHMHIGARARERERKISSLTNTYRLIVYSIYTNHTDVHTPRVDGGKLHSARCTAFRIE
jgi:hypothetical protein